MTRKHESVEDLKRSIAELDVLIKETGDLRESLGLPRERKVYFVEYGHSRALVERVRVVQSVLTSYLQMLNDAKRLIPFPSATLAAYIDNLMLINHSEDMLLSRYGDALLSAIRTVQDGKESYERTVMDLYSYLDNGQKYLDLSDGNWRERDNFEGTPEELDTVVSNYLKHYNEVVKPAKEHEREVFANYEASKAGEEN